MSVDEFFAERRANTKTFLDQWRESFEKHLGDDGKDLLEKGTCVYAIGSAGRGEFGPHSDLDVFAVADGERKHIKKVNETLIQAAVIRAMRDHKLPEPSEDGRFLELYAAQDVMRQLGRPNDDPDNTFTVRMLLLLESRALAQESKYRALITTAVDAYWSNADMHRADYLPMVLVNDVVRYWRVLLLNYEAKHAEREREAIESRLEERMREARAKKRLASQKLRFSRALTCYSMITRLLLLTSRRHGGAAHVERDDVIKIVGETPVERLQMVRRSANDEMVTNLIDIMLTQYRDHLLLRDRSEAELIALFSTDARAVHVHASRVFGEKLFELLQYLGAESPLYRYVVV